MKRNWIWLLVGLILFGFGAYLNIQYEEHSLLVDALVTDIKISDDSDEQGDYRHTYYGSYTADGKEYTDQKLFSKYSSSALPENLFVGDTYQLRVNPEKPGQKMLEGGFIITVGLVIAVYNGVVLYKNRKKEPAD